MKFKHTKLKKSLFLILICISLTTTFVVSTSADFDSHYFLEINSHSSSSGESIQLFSYPLGFLPETSTTSLNYYQNFEFIFIPDISIIDPSLSGPYTLLNFSYADESLYLDLDSLYFPYRIDSFFINGVEYSIYYEPLSYEGITIFTCYIRFDALGVGDVIVDFYEDLPSPSFLDRIFSSLTSSLGWVGQLVNGLTSGSISPLLGCFAVTISVSAVLLGIYSIKRFIWGK